MIAAKKMLLVSGQKPFSYSGSWEKGSDGWAFSGLNRDNSSGTARTGIWGLRGGPVGGSATFLLSEKETKGLYVRVKAWHRSDRSSNNIRSVAYSVNDGSFIEVFSVNNNNQSFSQLDVRFKPGADGPVTVRFLANDVSRWDDWEIFGERT